MKNRFNLDHRADLQQRKNRGDETFDGSPANQGVHSSDPPPIRRVVTSDLARSAIEAQREVPFRKRRSSIDDSRFEMNSARSPDQGTLGGDNDRAVYTQPR